MGLLLPSVFFICKIWILTGLFCWLNDTWKVYPKLAGQRGHCCHVSVCAGSFLHSSRGRWRDSERSGAVPRIAQLSESQVQIQFTPGSKVTLIPINFWGRSLWGLRWASAFHLLMWATCCVCWCTYLTVWMCRVWLTVLHMSVSESNFKKTLSLICNLDPNQGWKEW